MRYSFNSLGKRFMPKEFSKYSDKVNKRVPKKRRPATNKKTTSNPTLYNAQKYGDSLSYTRKMDRLGGTWLVKFYKVDGTPRTMLCTRDWKLLSKMGSQEYTPPAGTGKVIPKHQVIVWDTQVRGFRSFRAKSVISFDRVSDDIIVSWNPSLKKSLEYVISKLDDNICKVVFYKKNGMRRVMRCTRGISGFQDDYEGSQNLIRVWDLDKNGYRTITYSTIVSLDVLDSLDQEVEVDNFSKLIPRTMFRSFSERVNDVINSLKPAPKLNSFFYLDGKLAKALSSFSDDLGNEVYELAVFDDEAIDAAESDNINPEMFEKLIEYREVPERILLNSEIKKVNIVKVPKFIRDLNIVY